MNDSIVIDLDGTICFHKENGDAYNKYALASPNIELIKIVNKLYDDGYFIIIHTARRMLTHKNDVFAVEADVGEITRTWLKEHNVSYHQLIFGKPFSTTYYVDDKAMLPEVFMEKFK